MSRVKPVTPGQRHKRKVCRSVTKGRPEKSLVYGYKCSAGRNNTGKMTMRYRGGGHKKKLRKIDFKGDKIGIPGVVKAIEYDPYRTAYIALVYYVDGEKRYIIASEGLKVGDKVMSGDDVTPDISCVLPLSKIQVGSLIYNIETNPGGGAKLVRSAGCWAKVLSKDDKFVTIKLPSGEMRLINIKCKATIGIVSNGGQINEKKGKAGVNRHLGRRPRVRGVAMNPIDHPMGGGEGKNAGQIPRTRKGIPSRGLKTRKKKKYSNKYIKQRREKK